MDRVHVVLVLLHHSHSPTACYSTPHMCLLVLCDVMPDSFSIINPGNSTANTIANAAAIPATANITANAAVTANTPKIISHLKRVHA